MTLRTRKTILVVEDDDALRELVVRTLSRDYDVVSAKDGLEASELLDEHTFDLLISDVMMPKVDGFSLARVLRSLGGERETPPIIFLTAKADAESVARGIALGAVHYIQKPFKLTELLSRVARVL